MSCKAVEMGLVSRKGRPSIEWYKDNKPQYYCYGYIDRMNEYPLECCEDCKKFVNHAQEDLDRYNVERGFKPKEILEQYRKRGL